MNAATDRIGASTLLRGAHVIDPGQNIDRVTDVLIRDGKISAVGDGLAAGDAQIVDLAGHYLSPGWIDIHVHVYGTLGFADPDSIGIYQGVTTYIEAGGPGIGTLDEFLAMLGGRTRTSLYVGPYIRPLGIIGLNFIEGNISSLDNIPLAQWIEFAREHRDLLRYLKLGAFENYGTGPLRIGKGLAETLGLPMYVHIGEIYEKPGQTPSYDIFRIAQKGDIITHLYHGNEGKVIDDEGRILPVILEAERRGVLFDIGFGGYNFAWHVAEKTSAQGLLPHIISSDVQQFNVLGPAYSLANVMSICTRLHMSVNDVIERVTINPARALALDDRAGSLRPGLPADITVFKVESGQFELADCRQQKRTVEKRFAPIMVFKDGERIACDLERCQDERNWFLQIAEDHLPEASKLFSAEQRAFLGDLAAEISHIDWGIYAPERLDLTKALDLQAAFHAVRRKHALAMRPALMAVFDSFLDSPFTMQVGLFLLRQERGFALERLKTVAGGRVAATV